MLSTQNQASEFDLANNYLQGNNEALGTLYTSYFPALIMVAYKYTADTEKSKDLVSSVFEKLLCLSLEKRLQLSLHEQKGLYPLIYCIVKNKCIDHLKSSQIQAVIRSQLSKFIYLPGTNAAFNRFEEEAFNTLLNNLPKRENEILDLHLKGYKNEEIAKDLKLSYNTVRNTLHSAKQHVRSLWRHFM